MRGRGFGKIGYADGLSDIWVYHSALNVWYWLKGETSSTNIGRYSVKGVPDQLSLPFRRFTASSVFTKTSGRLVLFGGVNHTSAYNDVWFIDFRVNSSYLSKTSSTFIPTTSLPELSITSIVLSTADPIMSTFAVIATDTHVATSTGFDTTVLGTSMNVAPSPIITTRHTTATTVPSEASFIETLTDNAVFVGITISATLLIILTCCICRRRSQKRRKSLTTITDETDDTLTYMSTTMPGGGTTLVNDESEFAVPAFLKFEAGAEFRWHKKIASGGGGVVHLGDALVPELSHGGSTIIVKVVAADRRKVGLHMVDAFDQEISVMYYLRQHRNIAALLGWCDEPMAMLMKYYAIGSLGDFIKSGYVKSKWMKEQFMLDISRGLGFMHVKGVAHCDMKPDNILIDRDLYGKLSCVLTDFGISQMYSANANLVHAYKVVNLRGASILFAAPEVVTRLRQKGDATKELAFAGDVYGFGMIVFVLLNSSNGWSPTLVLSKA